MSTVSTSHIRRDPRGVAWIDDTNVKVIEVVLDRLAHGWSPEEIHFQHPGLSLAQIHGALAHYYDHQAELDAEIASQEEAVRQLRTEAGDSPLVTWLRARRLLS
jgi:uncharacterized protein (DUF433 family)